MHRPKVRCWMSDFQAKLNERVSGLKKGQIAPLLAVACSDGVDEEEIRVITERAVEVGLSEPELREIIEAASAGRFTVTAADVEDALELAESMVYVILADGKITRVEVGTAMDILDSLGVAPEILLDMLEAIQDEAPVKSEGKEASQRFHDMISGWAK